MCSAFGIQHSCLCHINVYVLDVCCCFFYSHFNTIDYSTMQNVATTTTIDSGIYKSTFTSNYLMGMLHLFHLLITRIANISVICIHLEMICCTLIWCWCKPGTLKSDCITFIFGVVYYTRFNDDGVCLVLYFINGFCFFSS